MWDLPRPGLEPVSPALAGRLSTTAPPGKPLLFLFEFTFFCILHIPYPHFGAAVCASFYMPSFPFLCFLMFMTKAWQILSSSPSNPAWSLRPMSTITPKRKSRKKRKGKKNNHLKMNHDSTSRKKKKSNTKEETHSFHQILTFLYWYILYNQELIF